MSSDSHQEPQPAYLVRPFEGLSPSPELAQRIVAPPYDVLTTEEARDLAGDNSLSFLHVSKAEIDFPAGTDVYSAEVYARAGLNMRALIEKGAIVRDPRPGFYVYRIDYDGHVQTGLAAAASIDAYLDGRIKRHEVTRPDKEDDRVRQILAVEAHTGPVLGVHRDNPRIADLLTEITATPATVTGTAPDGSLHSLWRVDAPSVIDSLATTYNALDALYIGDGHHRSAAAARVAQQLRDDAQPGTRAPAPMLMVSFPESEIRILGYHRIVRDLGTMSDDDFLAALAVNFDMTASALPVTRPEPGQFGMYHAGRWLILRPKDDTVRDQDAVARLDVSVLSSTVLGPILGIGDLRTDPRIDFVGGPQGVEKLVRRVDQGEMAVGFTLCPMPASDLFAVADAGLIMPPKSTWFDPKLLDGLISCPLS